VGQPIAGTDMESSPIKDIKTLECGVYTGFFKFKFLVVLLRN